MNRNNSVMSTLVALFFIFLFLGFLFIAGTVLSNQDLLQARQVVILSDYEQIMLSHQATTEQLKGLNDKLVKLEIKIAEGTAQGQETAIEIQNEYAELVKSVNSLMEWVLERK